MPIWHPPNGSGTTQARPVAVPIRRPARDTPSCRCAEAVTDPDSTRRRLPAARTRRRIVMECILNDPIVASGTMQSRPWLLEKSRLASQRPPIVVMRVFFHGPPIIFGEYET